MQIGSSKSINDKGTGEMCLIASCLKYCVINSHQNKQSVAHLGSLIMYDFELTQFPPIATFHGQYNERRERAVKQQEAQYFWVDDGSVFLG